MPVVLQRNSRIRPRHQSGFCTVLLSLLFILAFQGVVLADLVTLPKEVVLIGPESTEQILVHDSKSANLEDLTHKVYYEAEDSEIVRVNPSGRIEAIANGITRIRIQHENKTVHVPVKVQGVDHPVPVSFEQQIMPLLTKSGCNSGGCHGKAEGQNGFKLSVFGFDPAGDYQAIVMEGRGRRVFPASSESSLLVTKASGKVPHGGGKKIPPDSLAYRRMIRWINEGMPFQSAGYEPVVALAVEPKEKTLSFSGTQQLKVTAIDSLGNRRCVTAEAEYDTNNPNIAGVNRQGTIQGGRIPGDAAILIRYMGHVSVCVATLPRVDSHFKRPPEANFIDRLVWNKLQSLGIPPSPVTEDATFLRRAFLDTIGTLPTAKEAKEFLLSQEANKRAKWIDRLLERPEYADYWAMKWADLLRVDRDTVGPAGAVAMTRWLRIQFRDNRPYDEFVREIVTAQGNITEEGPAGFYRSLEKPDIMSRSISQLFLGVRIECAQCHHHPSEKWGQEDYYALAGFFTGVSRLSRSSGDSIISRDGSDYTHPDSKKKYPTHALGVSSTRIPEGSDRRIQLANWMTSPDNPYLARSIVNRIWAHYLGRGLIEPIDDLRITNPATNEPLLNELADFLIKNHFNLKELTRAILNSQVYQLGLQIEANRGDDQNYSHALSRSLPAEVLLDAICQTTGVPEKFNGWPLGVRAIQMWDNRIPSYFLKLFGRPVRVTVCECERSNEPSIAQALHLMNASEIVGKIHSRHGLARKLAESNQTDSEIIHELFLGMFSRFPSVKEEQVFLQFFQDPKSSRRSAVEDVMWTLLNSTEFIYNH